MKLYIFLIILCIGYYYYHKYYPQPFIYHIYISIFIFIILLIKYLMTNQRSFVYKMANNINNANNIQLHELIPDYHNKQNDIKYKLADKQLLRCNNCKRTIDINYINYYKLSYIIPLQYGGPNDYNNLSLICPNCYQNII